MKYRNARDIFPEKLLKQIQKYVSGETIYIPAGAEKMDAWVIIWITEEQELKDFMCKYGEYVKDCKVVQR